VFCSKNAENEGKPRFAAAFCVSQFFPLILFCSKKAAFLCAFIVFAAAFCFEFVVFLVFLNVIGFILTVVI
jgi:hypothetical protein